MKLRQGFVSNSSTTSFCIYGVKTDKSFPYNLKKLEIYGSGPYDDDYHYVGMSWSDIQDDETGLQFKQRVEQLLKENGFDEECSTYEEAWYDG